jgi:ABC-type amino acid transport substrate-binding protein
MTLVTAPAGGPAGAAGLALLAACPRPPARGRPRQGQRHAAVCIWPDYYGITWRNPRTQQLTGIDIDLSAELGRDLKARAAMWTRRSPR